MQRPHEDSSPNLCFIFRDQRVAVIPLAGTKNFFLLSYGRQILGTALVANEVIEDIRRGHAEDLFVIKIKLDIKNPYEL